MLIYLMCFLSFGGNVWEDMVSFNISICIYLFFVNLIVSNLLVNSSYVEVMYFLCIVSMNY